MIIGYDLFNAPNNLVFDTALPTNQLNDVTLYNGIYDEMYITLDTAVTKTNSRPKGWFLKNIMHAKFENDLESGSLDADGHVITKIQLYRRDVMSDVDEWILVGQFDYTQDYNTYSFVDITAENDRTYQYAIVPVANTIMGEKTISEQVSVEYKGVFLSDLKDNYKIQFDFTQGETNYNKNSSVFTPLNGQFPVIVYGNQDYKTSRITFLPLSERQIKTGGTKVNGREERTIRDSVTSFLNNGKAKVLRNDNGEIMIIASHDVSSTPKSDALMDIQSVSFNYTELGKVSSSTLLETGLVGDVVRSNYTYDEYGNVIWDVGE